jgi:hypothetical protein
MTHKLKRALKFAERVQVLDLLKEVCEKTPDQFALYKDNWDDEAVAKKLGVTVSNVGSIRREMFGEIKRTLKAKVEDRLAELELRLTKVEEGLERLIDFGRP